MRVVTILVRHGTGKYQDAGQRIEEIFARQLPGIERTTITVDNELPPDYIRIQNNFEIILGGDNSSWEFSAWNKGMNYLGEEIWSYDLVHLVTSAFHTLYVDYLDRFNQTMLDVMVGRPVCVGHIDAYNEPIQIDSFASQHWLRTSFLFAPPVELKLMRDLVSVKKNWKIFGSGPDQPFVPDGTLSPNYQTYVLDWLTGRDIGQGSVWHSQIALQAESWDLFKGKATAIFNEHLFAIRLRAQGTRVIDATWLSSQLKSGGPDAVDWTTPWRKQLAERDDSKV